MVVRFVSLPCQGEDDFDTVGALIAETHRDGISIDPSARALIMDRIATTVKQPARHFPVSLVAVS